MDPSQFPLSKIKKSLNIIEIWINNHIEQPTALDKLAVEELFNAYYSTEEVYNELSALHSSSPPPTVTTAATELTELLITNLSTLYLEAYRLQYIFIKQYESTITLDIKNEIEFILKEIKEKIQQHGTTKHMTQLEEAIERIPDVIPTLSTNNNNHSIPSSPTPRFEKLSMNQQQQSSPSSPSSPSSLSNSSTVISSEQLNRLLTGYASSSTGMTNEQLAHELIMNPDFQLQSPKKSSSSSLSSSASPSNMTIEERIDTIARQAFFDQVNQDIQQGHMEKSVLPLIEDIKQRLLSFVSPTTSLAQAIHETLDLSFLDQQIKQHVFNLDNALQFILNTMLQMAAPIRDSSIQRIIDMKNNNNNKKNNDDDDDDDGNNKKIYGQLFRLILEILDLMSLDLMNYRLKSLRPHLVPMATEYEHNKFSQALSHSAVGLAKTRQWIQHSLQQLSNKQQQQHKEKIAVDKVLNQGYIDLFTAKTALTRLTCPETMLLDIDRLVNYQNEVQKLTIIAALVLIGRNMKMKDIKTFTKRLFFILQNDGVDGRLTLDHLYVEMEKALPEQSKATRQQKDWIRSMVSKTLSHSDPVYHLLVKRIISILSYQLTTGQFVEDGVLVSSGLDIVQRQLKTLCTKILIFTQYNRKVYASWYQDLIETLQEI